MSWELSLRTNHPGGGGGRGGAARATCHHFGVTIRSLNDLDDATFDIADARIVDGSVTLQGFVEEPVPGWGVARLPISLHVPRALELDVNDESGTGSLVLERIAIELTGVLLEGVIPCRVKIATSGPSEVTFDVGEEPIAVRRLGRWRPTAGESQ